jgi:hypothetical protein
MPFGPIRPTWASLHGFEDIDSPYFSELHAKYGLEERTMPARRGFFQVAICLAGVSRATRRRCRRERRTSSKQPTQRSSRPEVFSRTFSDVTRH